MKLIAKLLLFITPLVVLTSSKRYLAFVTKNPQSLNVNIHNWRILYNDSLVFSTIPQDYHKENPGRSIQRYFNLSLHQKEIQQTDSIQIKYYSDAMCGKDYPLIFILTTEGETISRIESKDKFNIYDLVSEYPNDTVFMVRYTDSECNYENEEIIWDEEHMASIMSLEIMR